MKVVAADSAAAILNEKFEAVTLVASVAVLVEPPYREAYIRLSEPIFKEVDDSFDVVVHELELCQSLLEAVKADVVHLDTSLGSFPVEELSPVELANLRLSKRATSNLLKILPRLRKVAGEIRRKYNIQVLAIGKESVPVRLAELTAAAQAVFYACEKALEQNEPLMLGLPLKCQLQVADGRVYLNSLIEAEHDLRGYAVDKAGVLEEVDLVDVPNPVARGFRAAKILLKH